MVTCLLDFCDNHFIMYANVKSVHNTSESSIILNINFMSLIKNVTTFHKAMLLLVSHFSRVRLCVTP